MCSTGPASRAGCSSLAEGEGGRGGQAGSPAGQEREGDTEEGHKKREAKTQDYLQGLFSYKHYLVSDLETCGYCSFLFLMFAPSIELELFF